MSYQTLADGTLACSLTKNDDAATSMVRFVQEHLVVILQPINERINDLYYKHEEQVKSICGMNSAVEKSSERLDRHDLDVIGLDTKHTHLETEFRGLLKELKDAALFRRLAAWDAEIRANKKSRGDIDDRMDRVGSAMQVLQTSLDETNAEIHRVQLKVWQSTNSTDKYERDAAEFRQEQRSMNDRQLGLSRAIEQVNSNHEKTRMTVMALSDQLAASGKTNDKIISSLEARTQKLEDFSASASQSLTKHDGTLAEFSKNLESINSHLGHIEQELHHLEEENQKQDASYELKLDELHQEAQNAMSEEARKNSTVLERLKLAEKDLVDLKAFVGKLLENNILKAVRDLHLGMEKHNNTIGQHSTAVRSLGASQTVHGERLQNLETRAGNSDSAQADLTKRADSVEENLRELLSSHKNAEHRIDNHHVELEKMEVLTTTTRHALGQTNTVVQNLQGDLGSAKGGLAKTAMRLELAHEYLHGMTKGMQETHKLSLAGQDGMLSPKTGSSRTRPLPTLAMAVRPSSAQRVKTSPRSVATPDIARHGGGP